MVEVQVNAHRIGTARKRKPAFAEQDRRFSGPINHIDVLKEGTDYKNLDLGRQFILLFIYFGVENYESKSKNKKIRVRILQPTPGLQLAKDPRIPDNYERFVFKLNNTAQVSRVEWIVNGKRVAVRVKHKKDYLWPVQRGRYVIYTRVWLGKKDKPLQTQKVSFLVK